MRKIDVIRILGVVVCAAMLPHAAQSQSAHTHKRNGDMFYDQGEYARAEEEFRKAKAKENSAQSTYNLGNAIFQQQRYDEAVRQYESAAQQAADDHVKAEAFYNLGNAHYQAQNLEKAVEAYKQALKIDPQDLATKNNLTFALQKLKQQQQQQQQQRDQEQQQQQPQEQEQEQQQEQQQEQEQEEQQQQQPQDLTKEQAEELLKIIQQEDEKVQEKLRKSSGDRRKPKKDW